jgi:hypothetical protein
MITLQFFYVKFHYHSICESIFLTFINLKKNECNWNKETQCATTIYPIQVLMKYKQIITEERPLKKL